MIRRGNSPALAKHRRIIPSANPFLLALSPITPTEELPREALVLHVLDSKTGGAAINAKHRTPSSIERPSCAGKGICSNQSLRRTGQS
jgi:hypothetical protein